MLFEIAAKNKFQQYCKDLAETKFKINMGETGVGKNKTSERNSKKRKIEKCIKTLLKVWNMVSLAARNSMDEYTDEEIIIIDDFRADSMQFNELLILLDPYHSAPAPARISKQVYSASFSNHNCSRTNRKLCIS